MLEQRLEAGLFVLGTFVIFSYFLIFSVGTVFSYYLIVSMGTMFSYFLRCSYMFSYFLIFSLLPTLYFELYFKISLCGSFTKLKMSGLRIITTFPLLCDVSSLVVWILITLRRLGDIWAHWWQKWPITPDIKPQENWLSMQTTTKSMKHNLVRFGHHHHCIVSKLGDAIASNLDSFHLSEVCFRPALDGLAKGWKGWTKVRDKK